MKLAIVLFNLGGPDSPEAVEPFLRNLFSDPAIIQLPGLVRIPLARLIARRRAPVARAIYDHIGGRSPILAQTLDQARALEAAVTSTEINTKAFVAMRCWHPFSGGAALAVKQFGPDKIVLLPLYPQYSTTTSASSLKDWDRAARKAELDVPTARICCYPDNPNFIAAAAERIRASMENLVPGLSYRLLLSAHGLPKRVVEGGDPYQWQVEQSARALVDALGIDDRADFDHRICYQSRVGPLKWLEPSTDAEIRRAGAERRGVIVAPIAFVSEHSETLVELDIEYAKLAREAGVPDYRRAGTVGAHPVFIEGLA
ncbi:MAG TPA: ferrochelatase, partial [Rhizomicrobium sp.]|nr:ferrochelatase [Rhizomicrobium sp.]